MKAAISRLDEGVEQSIKNAKNHAQHLADKLDSLNHLNEKIWLTLSQLKVQLAQGEDGQAESSNMNSIVQELGTLSEEIEQELNHIQTKLEKIMKTLNTGLR